MTTHTKHDHGTFSWTDLGTTDVDGAKKFYGALFGWKMEDQPSGPGMTYTMCSVGGKSACAMYTQDAEQKKMGMPPMWMVYFTVTDVDAATKKVSAAGGKVHKEPFDVMDVGRMSVIADPTGAVSCLWQAKKHIGAEIIQEPGAISWAELATNNVDAAGKFYTSVIGWKSDHMQMGPMTYTVFKRGDAQAAGMMAQSPEMKGMPSAWTVYFSVANCDATVKKANELGGKTIAPAMDIPNVGRFAWISDPQGAVFGILQAAPRT